MLQLSGSSAKSPFVRESTCLSWEKVKAVQVHRETAAQCGLAEIHQQLKTPRYNKHKVKRFNRFHVGSFALGCVTPFSLCLADATLKAVLAGLLKGTGYTYKVEKHDGTDLYIVGTGELMAGGINPLVTSKQISLNYLDSTKVLELLPATVPDASITAIPDQKL